MGAYELNNLYRLPSHFDQEVLDVAREWADEIRPGLRDISGKVANSDILAGEVSPMVLLEDRVRGFGISSSQSIGELAFIGIDLSREREKELAEKIRNNS